MYLLISLFFSFDAHAYIDPGASGVILQFLATVLGIVLFNIKRLVRSIRKRFKDGEDSE
tara:strand:+ start:7962 stop:8138 length:177 start_codon:yes stop_codon:yes gene_type:complete